MAVTHPERVVYPAEGITKFDIVRYCRSVADRMLPHLAGRPLTLVACMSGITNGRQYLRHSKLWGPKVIRRVRIRESHEHVHFGILAPSTRTRTGVRAHRLEPINACRATRAIHAWNRSSASQTRSVASLLEQPATAD